MVPIYYCLLFFFLLIHPAFSEAVNTSDSDSVQTAPTSAQQNQPLWQLFNQTQQQIRNKTETAHAPSLNEQLAAAFGKILSSTGSFTQSVGQSISQSMAKNQEAREQKQLLSVFYMHLDRNTQNLPLSPSDLDALREKIKAAYIEDAVSGRYALDTNTFHDMPELVKMEYADLLFQKTTEGKIETYYPTGAVKTRWNFQNGKLQGPAITFYENGEILYIDQYEQGVKIRRQKFTPEGRLEFDQRYDLLAPDLAGASGSTSQNSETLQAPVFETTPVSSS